MLTKDGRVVVWHTTESIPMYQASNVEVVCRSEEYGGVLLAMMVTYGEYDEDGPTLAYAALDESYFPFESEEALLSDTHWYINVSIKYLADQMARTLLSFDNKSSKAVRGIEGIELWKFATD